MFRIATIVIAGLLSLSGLPNAMVRADVSLSFGVYTSDKPSTMVKIFRPILTELEAKLAARLGEPVRISIQVANTYEKCVDNLVQGKVDFARLGPASYVLAKQANPKLSILALEHKNGQKTFNGIICVRQDSSVRDVSELRGKGFAFGNERSTIGRYLSQLYLMNHGVIADDLAGYAYLGRHDKVGAAVAAGQYAAGALKESTFDKLVAKGVTIRAIATFPNVTKPWVAHSALPDHIVIALREALYAIDDPDVLKNLKKHGFIPGSDEDYQTTREAMLNNSRFFE